VKFILLIKNQNIIQIRHMLYFGLLLMFLGNTLYLTAHLFVKTNRRYLLLAARFVTGIGSSEFLIHICLRITF